MHKEVGILRDRARAVCRQLQHAIAQLYNQPGALLFHSAGSFCTRFNACFPLCSLAYPNLHERCFL